MRLRYLKVRAGLSLIEVVISTTLVAIVLVGALKCVGSAVNGSTVLSKYGRAEQLAAQLMAEILEQDYREPIETPIFGREPSESGGSRADWDDVDDYHLWSASPPEGRGGTALENFDGWTREVVVEWVSPANPASTLGTDQGVKRVTVEVEHNGLVLARLVSLRSDKYIGEEL